MKNKHAGVAKVVALAVVPAALMAVLADVAQKRRAENSTQELLKFVSSYELRQPQDTTVLDLIAQGADVNARDAKGSTPLLYAAITSSWNVQDLVNHGAEVNPRGDVKVTPLVIAVLSRNVEAVRVLLRSGADVNVPIPWTDGKNFTPLAIAKSHLSFSKRLSKNSGARAQEIIQLLKAAGAKE